MITTRYVTRPEGRIAYDVTGSGPLVVCIPGMGDVRAEYRYLAPRLVDAGYTVVTTDLRGHGDSDATFSTYERTDAGDDVLAVLDALARDGHDGPAHLVGTSFGAAAAVWAAAQAPERVAGVTLISPFVRDLPVPAAQRIALPVLFARPWGRRAWLWWYVRAHAGRLPADFAAYRAALHRSLADPARVRAVRAMGTASSARIDPRLEEVPGPALVVVGTADPDFDDPRAEAEAVAARTGGTVLMVDDAGHYPQVQQPDVVAERIVAVLRTARTSG